MRGRVRKPLNILSFRRVNIANKHHEKPRTVFVSAIQFLIKREKIDIKSHIS